MGTTMAKRTQLTKSVRFEVFKRDSFTCAYCGNHPPAVVLEVDHINPVKSGGDNSIDNLITSCFDCNRGKGCRELSIVPAKLKDRQSDLEEIESQLDAYRKFMDLRNKRINNDIEMVVSVFEEYWPGKTLTDSAKRSVGKFLETLYVDDVIANADKALVNCAGKHYAFKYFCAICWRQIKAINNG